MNDKDKVPEYFVNEKNEIYRRIDKLANSDSNQNLDILCIYDKIFEMSDEITSMSKKIDVTSGEISELKKDIEQFRHHVDNGFQQSIVGKLATEMMAMIKKEKEDAARIKLRKLDVLIIALSGTGLLAFGLKLLFDFLNR
jgi:uncharacterized coiled-coil DUF342 family protein